MKKLLIFITMILVSVSLFSQEAEDTDVKTEASSINKNVFRFHIETIAVFSGDKNVNSWVADNSDYALAGVGLSYSRLFSDHVGMTIVFGGVFSGVNEPFSEDFSMNNIDWKAGAYPFDINRRGFFAKLGPYFKIGRIGITPAFETAVIFSGNPSNSTATTEVDQIAGLSLGIDIYVTDSFLIYVEGAVMSGYRVTGNNFWDAVIAAAEDDDDYYSFFETWYSEDSINLLAGSLTVGVGMAF